MRGTWPKLGGKMRGTWLRLRAEATGIRTGFLEMASDLRPINSHPFLFKRWLIVPTALGSEDVTKRFRKALPPCLTETVLNQP